MRIHGTPIYIVSVRDARSARVCKEFKEAMGRELKFSTTFHPQKWTIMRAIKMLEDLLK